MRCRVELTDSIPREEYNRPVEYRNYNEPGESQRACPVKVTAIQAQPKVWLGGEVPVHVTVANYATHEKIAEVILQDYTNNVLIGKSEVVLPPQASKTLIFHWKTRGFSLGEHVLHAEAVSDPEPYYEYSSTSTDRIEHSNKVDSDEGYMRRSPDNELERIIAEAEEILSRVEQEWEDASTARDRATDEAERIIAEADEQVQEQSQQAYAEAEGKAHAILDDAVQQADGILQDAETVRKQAEEYKEQIAAEVGAQAEELCQQSRIKAEREAQDIRDQALKCAEELMSEIQKQLEAAKALRGLAKTLADVAGVGTGESDYDVAAYEVPDAGITDETERAGTRSHTEAGEEPETETGSSAGKNHRLNLRWYHTIIALALVAAAVLLSVGIISLG